jgi:hypothetical protein
VKRTLLFTLGFIALAAVGSIAFSRNYNAGRVYGQQLTSLETFYAAHASLQSPSLAPQTREYIKAQFYYFGCQIQPHVIRNMPIVDYGPVDDATLDGTEPFLRHGDTPNDYYQELQRIHATK